MARGLLGIGRVGLLVGLMLATMYLSAPTGHAWQGKSVPPVPQLPAMQVSQPDNTAKPANQTVRDADIIRVGISDNAMTALEYPTTTLSSTTGFTLAEKSGRHLVTMKRGQRLSITVSSQGFAVSTLRNQRFTGPLLAKPTTPTGRMVVANITRRGIHPQYKGYLEITRGYSSPAKLSVVNVLPLQEYLKAVVPNELPPRYGFEAVKAQSVAARNYAIRPREKTYPQFDICDSQLCQVYFGAQTEHAAANQALQETHGLIALYEGQPILALYSSAHGGHSEDYANAFSDPASKQFPGTPVAYLTGKPDKPSVAQNYGDLRQEENARRFWLDKHVSDFDGKSSYHRWEKRWPIAQLNRQLNDQWVALSKAKNTASFVQPAVTTPNPLGELKRIHVLERGVSGKAIRMALETTRGRFLVSKEYVIRKLFRHGRRMLPSANVVFSHLTDPRGRLVALKANGGGFGHGVGMSQLGASTLSDRAHTFDQILQHYYTGVSLGTIPISVDTTHQQPQRVTFTVPNRGQVQPVLVVNHPKNVNTLPALQLNNAPLTGDLTQGTHHIVPVPTNDKNTTPNWLSAVTTLFQQSKTAQPTMAETRLPLSLSQFHRGKINQLALYPSNQGVPYRVWIELIPPREQPLR